MNNILEELKRKQETIVGLQRKKARQEGQRDQLLQQLKEKFSKDSLIEGRKKLIEIDNEVLKNDERIEKLDNEMEGIISKASSKKTEN